MIQLLLLVAMISFMVSLLTYTSKEGFLTNDEALGLFSNLTPEQSKKAELLNDPSLFNLDGDSLTINMPVYVKRDIRVVGKDSRIEMNMGSGKIGGLRLDTKDSDQSRLNVIRDTNKGAIPLKWFVITEDGVETTLGSLAGHRFNYRRVSNSYIPGYPKNYNHEILGVKQFKNRQDALYACDAHPYCRGITYDKRTKTSTLRGNNVRIHNGIKIITYRNTNEDSYVKIV
jgi:hypothetical protein